MDPKLDLAVASENIAYLDLNQVTLFGYETKKSDLVIDSLVRALDCGRKDFPLVHVYRTAESTYELVNDGHRWAVAHFIANKRLKCLIMGFRASTYYFDIKDTALEDDSKLAEHMQYAYIKSIIPAYW